MRTGLELVRPTAARATMGTLAKWVMYLLAVAIITIAITATFHPVVAWIRATYYHSGDSTGDVFAGVAAFFSALAFGLLIPTVLLQAHELSLQRRELADTKDILSRQADTLAHQQFESTFFNLLSVHADIVRTFSIEHSRTSRSRLPVAVGGGVMEMTHPPTHVEGRAVLRVILEDFGVVANRLEEEHPAWGKEQVLREAYSKSYAKHRDVLGHYFRNLYHIIKFVDVARLPAPKQYTNLVRAQLSGPELELLFYNGSSEWGEKFRPLLIKYSMLEHLPLGEYVPRVALRMYPEAAFGDSVVLLHYRADIPVSEPPQAP